MAAGARREKEEPSIYPVWRREGGVALDREPPLGANIRAKRYHFILFRNIIIQDYFNLRVICLIVSAAGNWIPQLPSAVD